MAGVVGGGHLLTSGWIHVTDGVAPHSLGVEAHHNNNSN